MANAFAKFHSNKRQDWISNTSIFMPNTIRGHDTGHWHGGSHIYVYLCALSDASYTHMVIL